VDLFMLGLMNRMLAAPFASTALAVFSFHAAAGFNIAAAIVIALIFLGAPWW
jgi:hypothetical protein